MNAFRQNFLGHKIAFVIHGYGITGHPDSVPFGNIFAVGLHRTAAERDIAKRNSTLAISGQQFFVGIVSGNGWIDLIDNP